MPVRDLGYKPYEGERLPARHNTSVLVRHGLRRAWSSWLVKIALFFGWTPGILYAGYVFLEYRALSQLGRTPPAPLVAKISQEAIPVMVAMLGWQMWLFVTLASLGAGAGAIAEDLTHRAFQFYLAKPVTPEQYLAGRILAVFVFCFGLMAFPCIVGVVSLTTFALGGDRLTRLGLILPGLAQSGLVALTLAAVSVGISSLSRSRALTMSAWVMVFLIPEVIRVIVTQVTGWPWLGLASLPALLDTVSNALFHQPAKTDLHWYHALPVLLVWIGGSVTLALVRLRRAEVIT